MGGSGTPEASLLEAPTAQLLGHCTSLLARQFSIPAPLFAELRRRHDGAVEEAQLWRALIAAAAARAVAPISGFMVGAVGLGASGTVYAGVNMEFPGMPLSASVHAEQFLVANALAAGETALRFIAVSAPPCGHCRQFLAEVNDVDSMQILFGSGPPHDLGQLLPNRFGPADLLGPDVCPVFSRNTGVKPDRRCRDGEECGNDNSVTKPDVEAAARKALRDLAHAPYSRCPSAVVLRCCCCMEGASTDASSLATKVSTTVMASGGCIESVAYNPTLPALQAALVALRVRGADGWAGIREAVLVERAGAAVSQAAVTRAMLATLNPDASFRVVYVDEEECSC